jgi:hypothetical protein
LPPIAASAAVSGQPSTGFGRARSPLPESAFLLALLLSVYSPSSEDWRLVMIVEVRSYRIKPGKRDEFIRLFETRAIDAQRSYGMKVTGPFLDVENPNKFVFLRSFPSLEERDRMKDAFYGGDLWKNELEALAMSMLDSYDVILCEVSPGCVFDIN